MARGNNFGALYGNSTGAGPCSNAPADQSIAGLILEKNQICSGVTAGSALPGYDIKSQDSLTMLRLSLLATTDGSEFKELYIDKNGVCQIVSVGVTPAAPTNAVCLYKNISSQFVNKVDHVIVRGRDPLPVRVHGGSVSIMGNGIPNSFNYSCGLTYFAKGTALRNEAWAEFERSQQSDATQQALKALVNRANFEQLVGYKYSFSNIPQYASMGISQTTPKSIDIGFGGLETEVQLNLGSTLPDAGGITDISNVNTVAAPVLDIVRGTDVQALFQDTAVGTQVPPNLSFTELDYYVLLDHQCSLYSLSKGKEWFLLPTNSPDQVKVRIRSNESDSIAFEVFGSISQALVGATAHVFRRNDGSIGSISDFINNNANPPTNSQGVPVRSPRPPFDVAGGAYETGLYSQIVPGIGGNFGVELFDMQLAYAVQKPSIQIRSPFGDARAIAANVAAGGITATALLISDKPTPIGYNGQLVRFPTPPNDELQQYCPDPIPNIQELEGTIVDMSAPFLNEAGVVTFSTNLKTYIDGDNGNFETRTYLNGGYTWLPGQSLEGRTIHSIDYSYADKDSMVTNVTLGPRYYQVNSYNDSQYVKRTETVTRTGRVVGGSNEVGEFTVLIDGIGVMNAVNGIIDPVYPGDRVEVKVLNYPIEP